MEIFDFIIDDRFRKCLEADYEELTTAIYNECWKAAHVLAGSIVEAILVDYLIASDFTERTNKDPLQMHLVDIIQVCRDEGIVTEKIAGLSHVVRGYRNLIHPGRLVRNAEVVDENGATVAITLVNMVAGEIATKSQAAFGYTAQQIVTKIEKDPSAISFLEHLLKKMRPHEYERLLIDVIPERLSELNASWWSDEEVDTKVIEALKAAFRTAFQLTHYELRTKVMTRYTTILKEESGEIIREYEDDLVRAPDFEYLDENDLPLVIEHLLARLKNEVSESSLIVVDGLAEFIQDKAKLHKFVDVLVRAMIRKPQEEVARKAQEVLERAYKTTSEHQDSIIAERLGEWEIACTNNKNDEAANMVREIKSTYNASAELSEVDEEE